ncbi:MAG TPA: hypothetical protein ENK31_08540 [Nannocystis exedens]|nr:hypothetical protein [Nannocystis exedens]
MRRRSFIAAGLSLPLVGAGGRELLRSRRAAFVEVGDSVLMSVKLPELLSTRDRDAMASIESAFTTTLVFEIKLYQSGTSRPISARRRLVKIQWNPWKERFGVQTSDPGSGTRTSYFRYRNRAIARAVGLDRVLVAKTSTLRRGRDSTYFVTVVGQRNPITAALLPEEVVVGQGQGNDLSAFSRWIGIFIRDTPAAEKTFAIRTTPAFYLVP